MAKSDEERVGKVPVARSFRRCWAASCQAQTAALTRRASRAPAHARCIWPRFPDATTRSPARPEYAGQPLHVLVGRSILLETPRRLKRVYVSNPLIIDSFTSSPTQIVVTAKTPGVSSLILWDEAGQSQTYLVSSDLDVASLQKEIHEACRMTTSRWKRSRTASLFPARCGAMLPPRRPSSWPVSMRRMWSIRWW